MDNWTLWYLTAQTVRLAEERSLAARAQKSNGFIQIQPKGDAELDRETDITKRTVRERKFEMPEHSNDDDSTRAYISN